MANIVYNEFDREQIVERMKAYEAANEKYDLVRAIYTLNEELKLLEETVKKLKVRAQGEFPIGTTLVNKPEYGDVAVAVTITEVKKNNFDSTAFKAAYPVLYNQFLKPSSYKTVTCSELSVEVQNA